MESLADRADRALLDHPAPALLLDELRRLLDEPPPVVADPLRRSVESDRDRFRLLLLRAGPWGALTDEAPGPRPPGPDPGSGPARHPSLDFLGPWILPGTTRLADGGGPEPEDDLGRRARGSLRWLGWSVDEGSAEELARWIRLVRSHRRWRERKGREGQDGSGRRKSPERHSSSASTASHAGPRPSISAAKPSHS